MNTTSSMITGAGLGAGLMYLLDPERGDTRRATLGERVASAAGSAAELVDSVARDTDLADRARQVGDRAREVGDRARAMGDRAASPLRQLREELRDVVRDPRSFRPRLDNGRLRLRRPGTLESLGANVWMIVGVIAGAAAAAWLIQRNMSGAREVHVRRGVTIDVPIERVWDFWSHVENFPRFMSHVREVRTLGADRTHWVVDGPAGTPVEWDAETTVMRPHEMIAWRTVEGALVEHNGTVRFTRVGDQATHVEVALSYRPMGGMFGHGVASLFGTDPESALDEDLRRLKAQLEGREPVGPNGRSREWR
jgi:uncharacterized membrane protein